MTGMVIDVADGVGALRLDRPEALHALDTAMCAAMLDALERWEDDPAVALVVIDHARGRGFCAGGDIRMIAQSAVSDGSAARDFFRVEYRLNHRLFHYPKPVVAFMDGVTMGGGVGISAPARYRVATENTRLAMPETGIGLFTDVGGGWYLSRLAGRYGQFLALTGYRLNGAECLALGLATHFVPADDLPALRAALAERPADIAAVLDAFATEPPVAPIVAHRDAIDTLFASDRLEDIVAALAAADTDWAREQHAILATKSPLSMKVCLRLLEMSRSLATFEDEMRLEYAIASHMMAYPDFPEGVRALIVEKDNRPIWNPASADRVTAATVDAIVAPLSADSAWTPVKETL